MKYFDNHRCLSWSEESKSMWTHEDGGTWELFPSDRESHLWSKYFNYASLRLCVPFIGDFIFSVRVPSFFSYVLCYPYFSFHVVYFIYVLITFQVLTCQTNPLDASSEGDFFLIGSDEMSKICKLGGCFNCILTIEYNWRLSIFQSYSHYLWDGIYHIFV